MPRKGGTVIFKLKLYVFALVSSSDALNQKILDPLHIFMKILLAIKFHKKELIYLLGWHGIVLVKFSSVAKHKCINKWASNHCYIAHLTPLTRWSIFFDIINQVWHTLSVYDIGNVLVQVVGLVGTRICIWNRTETRNVFSSRENLFTKALCMRCVNLFVIHLFSFRKNSISNVGRGNVSVIIMSFNNWLTVS